AVIFLTVAAIQARADVLFESGILGPTGMTWDDLLAGNVGGTNISSVVFTGVRFQLQQPAVTTQIGGHFLGRSGSNPIGDDSFFGAIVSLTDENDFPDSGNLTTPDVLGHTLLGFPSRSAEVFGELNIHLNPGWYGLIFGGGLFGATAEGVALRNNPDIGGPSYIAHQPGAGWFDLSDLSDAIKFVDHRFVVLGNSVPEPSTLRLTPCFVVV
ncbi:unnamed protein product, partial [marine sediment metagenome]